MNEKDIFMDEPDLESIAEMTMPKICRACENEGKLITGKYYRIEAFNMVLFGYACEKHIKELEDMNNNLKGKVK